MVQKRDNLKLDIIEQLLKRENHVRGIAKVLNRPHTTISRKLNSLKEQNILDARTEGKNKIFSLRDNINARNYIYQTETNKLNKLLNKHPELSILFEDILDKSKDKLIILFGSYAKGLEKKDSDIDIYIETKNRNTKKLIESIHSKLSVKIGSFDMSTPLIKEIIKNHIIIRGIEVFYEQIPK